MLEPPVVSMEVQESHVLETLKPATTGPLGDNLGTMKKQRKISAQTGASVTLEMSPTSMRPVSGWKLRAGSSVVTRH